MTETGSAGVGTRDEQDMALDPIELAVALMGIESISGGEAPVITFVESLLARRGWRCRRIPVTDGRDALVAQSAESIDVTLSTHLDTVPPYIPPRLEGELLWGRGACDAKGIAAAMIVAAERLRARRVRVALLFVIGEETNHDGAHAANRLATGSRVLINGEPTESMLAVGTKGALRADIVVTGVAAHSAYPELGRSAIDGLVRLLHELQTMPLPHDPLLGATTVNVGRIEGGVADNVLAPWARARVMLRTVTPSEEVFALLERWCGDRAQLVREKAVPAVKLGTIPGLPTAVMAYATDIPELTNWGTPYLFGPGTINLAHRDDEHIPVAELRGAVDGYVTLAERALAAQDQPGRS